MDGSGDRGRGAIRVALSDVDTLSGEGLRSRLDAQAGFAVVAPDESADVIVLHVGSTNPREVRRYAASHPDAALVLLACCIAHRFDELMRAGASACLPADMPPSDIVNAIAFAARGGRLAIGGRQSLAPALETALSRLTRRETEVHGLLTRGYTNPEIARALHITTHTAHSHVKQVLKKLGLTSRRQLLQLRDVTEAA